MRSLPASQRLAGAIVTLSCSLLAQSLPLPGSHLAFVPAPLQITGQGALADVDNDGDADWIHPALDGSVSPPTTFSLLVSLSNGGTFAPPLVLPTGASPVAVATGDVDRDGFADIAVTCLGTTASGPQVFVFRNGGNAFAGAPLVLPSSRWFRRVELVRADANADLDLLLVDGNGDAAFRLGLGGGAFGPEIAGPRIQYPHVLFDDDGDGDDDVHGIDVLGQFETRRNLGGVTFGPPAVRCAVSTDVNYATFADLDGDGAVDVLLSGSRTAPVRTVVQVAFGGAGGTLSPAPPQVLAAEQASWLPAVHDFDGDGRGDLLLAGSSTGAVVVSARNDGTGRFGDVQVMRYPSDSRLFPRTGDVDGDGRSDVVVGTVLHRSLGTTLGGSRDVAVPLAQSLLQANASTLHLGDFDLNGSPDAVLALNGSGVVLARDFAATPVFTTVPMTDVRDVALGDWNRDGNLDVLAARAAGVQLLLGDGAGGLVAQPPVATATAPVMLRAGDFDGDLRLDAAVLTQGLEILLGDGAGGFGVPMVTAVCTGACLRPLTLHVADFDGDGALDVATGVLDGPLQSPRLDLWRSIGGGALQPLASVTAWSFALLAQDLDADGVVDLAYTSPDGAILVVHRGLGGGSFAAASVHPVRTPLGVGQFGNNTLGGGIRPGAIAAGDVDGDGLPELAVAGGAVLPNLGGGAFGPAQFQWIQQGDAIAIADVDGDLQGDLVVLTPRGHAQVPNAHLVLVENVTAATGGGSTHGAGCPGTGGFAPRLAAIGLPQPGGTLTFAVDRALGGSIGWLGLGPTPSTQLLGHGCRLFVDLQGLVTLPLPLAGLPVAGAGAGSVTLAIPPGLPPIQVAAEGIVLDFASPFWLTGTNGLRLSIR